VPLIIHDPERFPRGKPITANLSTRRLFHTILDIAGVNPPLPEGDPNANIAALSLTNAVNDAEDLEGGIAFSEAYPPLTFVHVIEHRNPSVIERMRLREVRRSIYDGNYKLIICGEKVESLYNIAADPAETRNLIANDPTRLAEMQRKLTAFIQQFEPSPKPDPATNEDDEQVLEHLRALGYIE
jgi:arylsulfatase A-like enzyme